MIDGILAAIGGLASGGLLGGAVGLFGTWLKGREEREMFKLKNAHDLAMREASRAEMELEHTLRLRQTEEEFAGKMAIAETEANAAMEVAASQALIASYGHDATRYGGGLVDAVRGLMRPAITLYLLAVMSVIAWNLYQMNAIEQVQPSEAWRLFALVVQDAVFLCVTAVTWWFGTRPTANRGR